MKRLFFFCSLIVLLLIFHDNVISGAADGLMLWYRVIIPTLLPFILITNAMSESHSYDVLTSYNPKTYCITAILIGNLCGYPIGAKILNDFVHDKKIPNSVSLSMLSVSSQASPMFLIGYVYNRVLEKTIPLFSFLILIYLPTILFSAIKIRKIKQNSYTILTPKTNKSSNNYQKSFLNSVRIIVVIGVYIMIFSIILRIILTHTKYLYLKCCLSFLEITTGLNLIKSLKINTSLKLPLIMSLSSFGGLCTAFQIKSVLTYEKPTIKKYLLDKLLLSAGTFLLTCLYHIFFSIV
ncbi:MAG: hypothetical protein K6G76_08120 [Lachnospiraceae bacterium]|nr:hypothetical protein [Lachnospiraceae bacterium]